MMGLFQALMDPQEKQEPKGPCAHLSRQNFGVYTEVMLEAILLDELPMPEVREEKHKGFFPAAKGALIELRKNPRFDEDMFWERVWNALEFDNRCYADFPIVGIAAAIVAVTANIKEEWEGKL